MAKAFSIFDLVSPQRVRAIVMAKASAELQALGLDEDDYVQEVYHRLLRADRSPRSRYDASRGRSPASYVHLVGASVLALHVKTARRRQERFVPVPPEKLKREARRAVDMTPEAIDRTLAALDLEIERKAALLMAGGCTVRELSRQLDLSTEEASEIRTRVRALLMGVRDEIAEAV